MSIKRFFCIHILPFGIALLTNILFGHGQASAETPSPFGLGSFHTRGLDAGDRSEPAGVNPSGSEIRGDALSLKCGHRLYRMLEAVSPNDKLTVWIFFTDYGSFEGSSRSALSQPISPRACRRIRLRSSIDSDRFDPKPVAEGYIDALRPYIERLRHVSWYFNAVSVEVAARELSGICSCPFVKRIEIVAVYRRSLIPIRMSDESFSLRSSLDDPLLGKYGESVHQLDQINVIELLEMGYNGSGEKTGSPPVLICMLDSGFDRRHEALEHVNVIAEWDFVQNDPVTSNEEGDCEDQDAHGTTVLGAIAGYHRGDLVGPAWGADFILAKTEIVDQEIRIEEDNWVAGIEWADSIGAGIVSTSLGYIDWYTPDSLDGDIPMCSRAADKAVEHGIVVVCSVGNFGYLGETSLTAPADGDSVIAVGAVYSSGEIVYFSSRGPTADGQIKPDLVAMGHGVHSVDHSTKSGYGKYSGTSLSAPLVAGICAILLEIHPDWSPIVVRDTLCATATRSGYPDNTYGYGIPQCLVASGLKVTDISDDVIISRGYPNPFRDELMLKLFLPVEKPVTVKIYDCRGALVRTLIEDRPLNWEWTLIWDGTNNAGRRVSGGVYFLALTSPVFKKTFKVLRIP